jgi:hypothetical protein
VVLLSPISPLIEARREDFSESHGGDTLESTETVPSEVDPSNLALSASITSGTSVGVVLDWLPQAS